VRTKEDEKQVEAFRELGKQVLGDGWVFRLAALVGVATRTAQRWAAGTSPVPDGVVNELRLQKHLLEASGLAEKAQGLADEAIAAGVSPHVVSAQMKELGRRLRPGPEDQDDNS